MGWSVVWKLGQLTWKATGSQASKRPYEESWYDLQHKRTSVSFSLPSPSGPSGGHYNLKPSERGVRPFSREAGCWVPRLSILLYSHKDRSSVFICFLLGGFDHARNIWLSVIQTCRFLPKGDVIWLGSRRRGLDSVEMLRRPAAVGKRLVTEERRVVWFPGNTAII